MLKPSEEKTMTRKNILKRTVLLTVFTVLSACSSTPVKPPDNRDITILPDHSLNIDSLTAHKTKVAANQAWQSSGVFLGNGEQVTVTASGSWSPAPLMLQWSGGEGNAFFGAEVPYITGGALMAKLGHDGSAFEIGINKTFQANDYGMLYLAMNDPFKWLYDNKGELDVAIYSSAGKSGNPSKHNAVLEIVSYRYNDRSGEGVLSAKINGDHFQTRNRMIKKIGEISSSKRVALLAGKESLQGGSYKVRDEETKDGVLTIKFETLW